MTSLAPSSADDPLAHHQVALVDLLDRVLATGVVISGDITLAIADIDLVRISLRALVASVGALAPPELPAPPTPLGSPELPGGLASPELPGGLASPELPGGLASPELPGAAAEGTS
ncbi:gas vesicle protein [Micromonospora sp. R77]|uniref:gas vesicle protein n=1 Tax=Micromonospora sp. R77 TaxID=2925836 RepID=UPI001F624CEE|nr:gas vesicle protein [Micromonospora sp. R77]MCI4063017.1 gas vesicle protein [Micromonospora sp. R77]